MLTSYIFNKLYFHESQEQNSFSVGSSSKARGGQDVSSKYVRRGSVVLSGKKTFKEMIFTGDVFVDSDHLFLPTLLTLSAQAGEKEDA